MGPRAIVIACLGFAAVLLLPPHGRLHAQEAPVRENWVEVWGGLAIGSPTWGVLGETPSMNLGLLGIRFHRLLGDEEASSRSTEFIVDLIPIARISSSYVSLRGTGADCEPGLLCVQPRLFSGGLFPPGSAWGIGINPAGILRRWRSDRILSPSMGAVVGGLLFDRATPTTQSTRFNFTAAIEAGVRVSPPGGHPTITVSYRLHHISNAGTGRENPGVASHLFSIGLTGNGHRGHN